jgi:uncharacterized protein YndB with AHSA1/START domain
MASDREIVSTRVFDAPRERVWEAFRDPDRLKHWWGPNGFTNTIQEFDLKPGGKWRLTMHGPGGADYHNVSTFIEVVKPARVVYQHEEPIHRFQMTMIFDEQGGKTKVTWRMLFESAEEFAKVQAFIADANEQNFDRLAEELKKLEQFQAKG